MGGDLPLFTQPPDCRSLSMRRGEDGVIPAALRGPRAGGDSKATAYASAPLPAGSAPMLRLASRFIGRTENRQTRTVSTSAAGCER